MFLLITTARLRGSEGEWEVPESVDRWWTLNTKNARVASRRRGLFNPQEPGGKLGRKFQLSKIPTQEPHFQDRRWPASKAENNLTMRVHGSEVGHVR